MKIIIIGTNSFVSKNLNPYLSSFFCVKVISYRDNNVDFNDSDVIISLVGKAHDLKNVSIPEDYYTVNTGFVSNIYDLFLASKAKIFITLSSVKAVADKIYEGVLYEDVSPNPITHYGKSKLLAEQYILSKNIPFDKKVYILRPCMIHGPGNKGNLNLLFNLVSKGLPWPLGNFENMRSYLSIENLCFIIKELITNGSVHSGVYNVSDDVPLSTNEVIQLIADSKGNKPRILKISKSLIMTFARIGDFLKLPLNSERLQKLTESYVVSNAKIKAAIGKPLPISSKEGLLITFQSFSSNA